MGKRTLPADATEDMFQTQLKRAVREVEERELGVSSHPDVRFVLTINAEELLAQHPSNDTLRGLVRIVHQRGPAVNVALVNPLGTIEDTEV